jgi:Kef-type K+ transport system membrane component KefB
MPHNIFFEISILLGITVTIACIVRFLRQPMLIAYIIAGIIAGPLFLGIIGENNSTFETFAQFGVILLLFMVGLSLNMSHIKAIGKTSTITGLAQVVFTAGFGILIARLLGFSWVSAAYLATALTFSSTIIIVKLLTDKKDTETVYGRHVFGLMIVQDLVAIALMLVLATFRDSGASLGEHLGFILVKGFALLALVYVLSKYALSWVLDQVARTSEFLFVFTIAWCFWLASLLHWAGFSLEIGAIIAGLTLGSSKYQPEIISRIKPLRDFFIVLFFIILGTQMVVSDVSQVIIPGIVFSLFILFGNPFILYFSFRLLKFTRRNSFLAGVTAAQVSEFGFILLMTGVGMGHISGAELPVFTVVALTTIFVSSYMITYSEQLYRFLIPVFTLFGRDKFQQKEHVEQVYDAWVFGYHRIGWKLCQVLAEEDISFGVVDYNPEVVSRLKRQRIPAYFGDAADVEFLENLHLEKSKIIISTIPNLDDQIALVSYIRRQSPKTCIIATLYDMDRAQELYRAGASFVMMPHLLGGQWISEVLLKKPWTARTFSHLRKHQDNEMKMRHSEGV